MGRTTIPKVDTAGLMIVLVTGSRDWINRGVVEAQFEALQPDLVIHGDCKGLDWIADAVAASNGINRLKVPANWNKHGNAAGSARNHFMVDLFLEVAHIDVCLGFPLPQSVGTWDCINYARSRGIATLVFGEDF